MPIVIPVAPGVPLSQGDILRAKGAMPPKGAPARDLACVVPLFTSIDLGTSEPAAGEFTAPFCLVLSRPCVTAHKVRIVVAAVTPDTSDIRKALGEPTTDNFKRAKKFFADVRDGMSSPDVFYLGQLEGVADAQVRYSARLDSLHTIELPDGEASPGERQRFVDAVRVARLDDAFTHDLHQRLFRAFASLGFDDHLWYPTNDLQLLVEEGNLDLARAQSACEEARRELRFAGEKTQEKKKREETVSRAEKLIDELENELAPLKKALADRLAARSLPLLNPDSTVTQPRPQ